MSTSLDVGVGEVVVKRLAYGARGGGECFSAQWRSEPAQGQRLARATRRAWQPRASVRSRRLSLARLSRFGGYRGPRCLISLIGAPLGLHYRAVAENWAGGDLWRRLGGQIEREFLQQQRQLGLRLGVPGENEYPTVGGRNVHIEHLHGGKFLDHTARGQPRRQGVQSSIQRDVQAISEEGDEPGLHGCNAFGRYRMKMCASMRRSS